jgi:hypothetical protein
MKMKNEKSSTWSKLFEVPTKAKTEKGIIKAIKRYADCYSNFTEEEMKELLESEYVTKCDDGIIIWEN